MLAIKDYLSTLIINFKKLKKKEILKLTGIPRKKNKSLYFVCEKLVEVNIKAKNKMYKRKHCFNCYGFIFHNVLDNFCLVYNVCMCVSTFACACVCGGQR